MQDMDVTTLGHSADMQLLEKYDLVYTGSYSFMFTYSAPQPAVVEMWTHVLEEVRT